MYYGGYNMQLTYVQRELDFDITLVHPVNCDLLIYQHLFNMFALWSLLDWKPCSLALALQKNPVFPSSINPTHKKKTPASQVITLDLLSSSNPPESAF